MIKIDKNQPKTIKMDINIQGIDRNRLNFYFRIDLDNMLISFKSILIEDNQLEISIPILSCLLVDLTPGRYKSYLEINDDEKYYLKPWEGDVFIEEEPHVEVSIDEHLDSPKINVNYTETVDQTLVKENKEQKKKTKNKKKKMTKVQAVKFVIDTRKKLKHENKQLVDKFLFNTLKEHGFKYKPEKENKPHNTDEKINDIKVENRDDIVEFLKSNGIKNETSLERLMESIETKGGDDIESMFDVAKKMITPQYNETNFNNENDILEFFKNQQTSNMNQQCSFLDGDNSFDNNETIGSDPNSNLMQQIQQNKAKLYEQLNLNEE